MLTKTKIEREIPQKFIDGLAANTPSYTLHGGVLRHTGEFGKPGTIAKHLVFPNQACLESIKNQVPCIHSLLSATTALSGMNLAVSIAGFAIVCKKLDEISKKILEVSAKLDQVLENQMHDAWLLEVKRRTTLKANLINLEIGLKTGRDGLIDMAFADLTKSSEFYRSVTLQQLKEMKKVYQNPAPVMATWRMAQASSLSQAQAMAILNEEKIALQILDNLKSWNADCLSQMESPLEQKPFWLRNLTLQQKTDCKNFVLTNRSVPEAIEYLENQYKLCLDYKIHTNDLCKLIGNSELAIVDPVS